MSVPTCKHLLDIGYQFLSICPFTHILYSKSWLLRAYFLVTLTEVGPIYSILIILLAPMRLRIFGYVWSPQVLRVVDHWLCHDDVSHDGGDDSESGDAQVDNLEKLETGELASINQSTDDIEHLPRVADQATEARQCRPVAVG